VPVPEAGLRVWVTELRPRLKDEFGYNGCKAPAEESAAAEACLLLAELRITLDALGRAAAVDIVESRRPCWGISDCCRSGRPAARARPAEREVPAPDGPPGRDGRDGVDGQDGLRVDGKDGKDGRREGREGREGRKNGKNGKDGAPGVDGKDGADGAPGVDGKNGKDGKDGAPAHRPDEAEGPLRRASEDGDALLHRSRRHRAPRSGGSR